MKQGLRKIHMGEAKLALDLSDGSERGEYVDQDYILGVLGRPHRNINLMYTYYPKDKQWPQRISEACKDMEINFQWDYPYDDYFPYGAEGEPFASMQDIRKHGQDVTLTLTIDCSLDDSYLRKIAQELRPYGRMRIRINHECAGDWFTHNRRFSFKEIADFFVRFAKILKEEAPNVKTIFCGGASTEEGKPVAHEDDFIEAYNTCCDALPDLTNLSWNIFLGSTYLDWEEVLAQRHKLLIFMLNNLGFNVTENMLNTFEMFQASNLNKEKI